MDIEKMMIDFSEYLKGESVQNESDAEKYLLKFMEERNIDPAEVLSSAVDSDEFGIYNNNDDEVYEYLELAENASSAKEALKYAKKALELAPENWNVACMVAELSAKTPESLLEKYEQLIARANAAMERDGWFSEEYIGEFWGFHETRPYMQLREAYLDTLVSCDMLKKAMVEAEDLLRLCENDNLGIRYHLMHLYAHFEDEEKALALLKKYDEESSMFMLPLSILYYKLGNWKKAAQYLRILNRRNKDTRRFFEVLIKADAEDLFDEIGTFGYQPFTIQELAVAFRENPFLFGSTAAYFSWGLKKLKAMKK